MQDFSLGRFGDRRLEKGGFLCTAGWLRAAVAGSVFAALVLAVPARCGSRGFCAIVR